MGDTIRTSLILTAILALAPVGASLGIEPLVEDPAYVRDILRVSGYVDERVFAEPEHLPSPAASSGIGPGSRIFIETYEGEFLCTANFIWTNGVDRYLGTAGHCIVPSDRTATHGPGADYNAGGSIVSVCVSGCNFGGQTGFILSGTMVRIGPATYGRQTDTTGDIGNDFGLIRIPPSLYPHIRPSMPVWGGPTVGSNPSNVEGQTICQYGHGIIVGEVFATQAKVGVGLGQNANGRYNAILGSQGGDSGSPTVTCGQDAGGLHGKAALGIHTHSTPAYTPLKAGTTVNKAKQMVARDYGASISIVLGS